MATSKETQARIKAAQKAGYSDAEIFAYYKNNPKTKKRIIAASKHYSEADIAKEMGLNINVTVKQPEQPKYEKPSFLADVGAGMDDIFSGIKQGALYVKDGVTGSNDYEKFTKEKADEKALYEKARQESGAGINIGRFVGQTVATLPAAAVAKGYQGTRSATQIAAVTGRNAASGAIAGGVAFAKDSDQRLNNTVSGGLAGVAGGVVGHQVGKGAAKVSKKVVPAAASRASARIGATIDDQIETALSSRNIRMGDLSDDILRGLRKDVGAALKSGKAVNKEAVARKVVFDRLGITPTKAQLTGDPKLWNQQAELSKVQTFKGNNPLQDKLIQDNEKLSTLMDDFVVNTNGAAPDQYGAMSKAVDALDNHNATMKQQVGQMYDAAKAAPGNDVLLDSAGFANDAITRLDADYAMSSLPQNVHKLIKDVADNPDKFTLGKSEEFIKILNREHKASLQNGQPTSTTYAIGVVRESLVKRQEQAMQGLLAQGNDAAQMWNIARTAHKMRVEQIEANPLLKDAVKGVEPDKLFTKHVLNGNVAELDSTIKLLKNVDGQAVDDIRGQVAEYIMDKTLQSNGQPSPSAMAKALQQIGDRRLNILFSPEEVAKLKDIGAAMHYLITQPPHSNINNSNTASAARNFLHSLSSRTPVTKWIVGATEDAVNIGRMNNALKPSLASKEKASSDLLDNILYGEEEKKLIELLTKLGVIGGANAARQ